MLPPEVPRCVHIKTNGVQCGSPAMIERTCCYFHQTWRENRRRQAAAKPYAVGRAVFQLPVLEDSNAVLHALEETVRALLEDRIELKGAALVLFALQTASAAMKP